MGSLKLPPPPDMWLFPKIKGLILVVPIIRIITYLGLFWGPHLWSPPCSSKNSGFQGRMSEADAVGTSEASCSIPGLQSKTNLDSQVAGNNRPLYPTVDHYWFKVARNYEPLLLV